MIRGAARTATRSVCLLAPTLLVTAALGAQTSPAVRILTTFRQFHGETRLLAELDYSAGALRVGAGRPDELYRMEMEYDDGRFTPLSAYDASRGHVTLGLRASGAMGLRAASGTTVRQNASVVLSPAADLLLDVTLGAAESVLELGGLRVSELMLRAGASRSTIRFSSPNGIRCRRATLVTGAAELTLAGLGNSRCDELEFEGGIGSATLDFGGAWTGDMRAELKMAMGHLTLRLPRGVGVRISSERTLARMDAPGFQQQGGAYVTPGYDRAPHKLGIALEAALGDVTVEWIERPR